MNIQYEDFAKLELKVATILEAKPHPNADKLLVLKVKLGEEERQIVAGIRKHYEGVDLTGKQIVIVANLEPRTLRGEISHGMLLAASDEAGNLALLQPDKALSPGAKVS